MTVVDILNIHNGVVPISLSTSLCILFLILQGCCVHFRTNGLVPNKYFITFVDDCTRKVWAYPLRLKGEVLTVFFRRLAEVENRTSPRGKTLRSDNGGEYTSRFFKQYLSEKGIRHQKTVQYECIMAVFTLSLWTILVLGYLCK